MSRDVAARYQTAADLAADLEAFLEGRPAAASPQPSAAVDLASLQPRDAPSLTRLPDGRCVVIWADGRVEFVAARLAGL
jgi:hypothetical protein